MNETQTTFYVATLAQYVLVDATNEEEARERGHDALAELAGGGTINIRTCRPATGDEIEFEQGHCEAVARERA